jgi:hypothetical protein
MPKNRNRQGLTFEFQLFLAIKIKQSWMFANLQSGHPHCFFHAFNWEYLFQRLAQGLLSLLYATLNHFWREQRNHSFLYLLSLYHQRCRPQKRILFLV